MANTSSNVKHTATVRYSELKTTLILANQGRGTLRRAGRRLTSLNGNRSVLITSLAGRRTYRSLISQLPLLSKFIDGTKVKGVLPLRFCSLRMLSRIFQVGYFSPVLLLGLLIGEGELGGGSSIIFATSVSNCGGITPTGNVCKASGDTLDTCVGCTTLRLTKGKVQYGTMRPKEVGAPLVSGQVLARRSMTGSMRRCPLGHCKRPDRITCTVVCLLSSTTS